MSTTRSIPRPDIQARVEQLQEQYARSLQRSRQLAEQRAKVQQRRQEVQDQRNRLNLDMASRRSALHSPDTVAAAAILDSAFRVSGMNLTLLWLDYVALGGDAGPTQLRSILAGEAPLLRLDHDRLVLALNERMAETGKGRPLAFWDGTH